MLVMHMLSIKYTYDPHIFLHAHENDISSNLYVYMYAPA